MSIRIKCTDRHHNVAYIYRRGDSGPFNCALANGTPAALSYAGISDDEMAAHFDLEDCKTAEQALFVCERRGSPSSRYEIV